MSVKISVVTVCYNAAAVMENTIKSVLSQNYPDMEYIIIDGASTDDTMEIINRLTHDDSRVRVMSEPDKGLYDAMNKGASLAVGDYVQFLNAGDTFYSTDVLSQVADFIESHPGSIYYGNICYVHPDGHTENRNYGPVCGKAVYYLTGDCINHQAIFAQRKCLDNGFDLRYRICADREWMMRQHKNACRFVSMGILVCNYSLDEDSISIRDKGAYNEEARALIKEYYPMGFFVYALFDFCRNNKVLAGLLHGIYRLLFIRKV